jgi:hypothetical protein
LAVNGLVEDDAILSDQELLKSRLRLSVEPGNLALDRAFQILVPELWVES